MPTKIDLEADVIYALVMRIGGEDSYTDSTKSQIWAESRQNDHLRNLARLYLAGSMERSEANLERLREAVIKVFFTDPVTGESRL